MLNSPTIVHRYGTSSNQEIAQSIKQQLVRKHGETYSGNQVKHMCVINNSSTVSLVLEFTHTFFHTQKLCTDILKVEGESG